ncbi:hypothetical protein VB773_06305 [Haloarculaceae archaeon H-GB2-1]|nr:hypothetical protein [Haloarculaceae archaeon H-GB1-1]MEA5385720.1 hypothetical protein [Haloarculaceae archaeon H-GB11]MEA5407221.1 hypothetical protein [Haloarculaceae archaeon H-GB2-1]
MCSQLSEPRCYVLLGARRRREVLRALQDLETPVSVRRLAEAIAASEPEERDRDIIERIHLTLHHNHLPRLAAAQVVDYDSDDGTVTQAANFGTLVGVLERVNASERPWADCME